MNRDLRHHQLDALTMLRASLAEGKKRPVLQMPTGAGKTLTAAAIVEGAMRKGNRVVFTVPAVELIDQTVEAFGAEGITDLGVIQADHILTDWMRPVQIASVQTLAMRKERPPTSLVVVDEAHRAFRVIREWMAACPDLPFIGLTATPWTKGMGKHWDALLIPTTTQKLIDLGFLSPFRVFAPSIPDLSKVSTVAGDYHEGQLAEVMSEPTLTADIVATWLKLGENRQTLCFGVDRAHARKLQNEFEAAGVRAAYMDGFTEKSDRELIRKAFERRDIQVVCNVGVLTTGVDWDVRCIIMARPTKSEILFTQIVGRALRTAEGKTDALILDHTGSTLKLGFVTDIHHDHLDTGRDPLNRPTPKAKAAPLPTLCTACSYLKPPAVHVCPTCGFAPERQSKIEAEAGELVQMRAKPKKPGRAELQKFYSGLLWYVEDRGYSKGWAGNQYRSKFGVWPRGLHDISAPPDHACRGWVTAQAIAYRKSREKRDAA